MSIFDELLILIDDQTEVHLERVQALLPHHSRQALSSTLGRLASRGWIEKTRGNGPIYRLSGEGSRYVTTVLDAMRQGSATWSGTWFCVMILLTEAERRQRDAVRRSLTNQGFGLLIDGLWLSPWNRLEQIGDLTKRLRIGSAILTFETQPLGKASTQMIIDRAWNWHTLEQLFQTFTDANKDKPEELARLARSAQTPDDKHRLRLAAKNTVFEYGLLLSRDPKLPASIAPTSQPRTQAEAIYKEVRQYCYQ